MVYWAGLKMRKHILIFLIIILLVALYFWVDFGAGTSSLNFLSMPEGFKISLAVEGLESPRVILFDSNGRMLVSETKAGRVSILEDKNQDGNFESKVVLIENLKSPHGLDFYENPQTETTYLYIAETHQVARYPYDVNTGRLISVTGQNIAFLPEDGKHFTRTIAFGSNFRKTSKRKRLCFFIRKF